ncbi:MAG: hypothetical protein ABFD94_07325 [Armatimonadia bacterium]
MTPPARTPWLALALGVLLTAFAIILLKLNLLPLGVPGQWEWLPIEVAGVPGPAYVAGLTVLLVALLIIGYAIQQERSPSRSIVVVALILCVLSSTLLMLGPALDYVPDNYNFAAVTVRVAAMGYYSYALTTPDLHEAFRLYSTPQEVVSIPGRVRTHPPGPYLFFRAGKALLERFPAPALWLDDYLSNHFNTTSDDLYRAARYYGIPGLTAQDMPRAWLTGAAATALGALLPLSVFLLAAALWDRRAGLLAALFAASLPSLLAFTPSIDGFAAALGVLPVALWAWGLKRQSLPLYAASGLALALATFWTAGLAVVVLPMAAMTWLRLKHDTTLGPCFEDDSHKPAACPVVRPEDDLPQPAACPVVRPEDDPPQPAARLVVRPEGPSASSQGREALVSDAPTARAQKGRQLSPRLLHLGVALALAVIAIFYLILLLRGYNLLANLLVISHEQQRQMEISHRTYLPWLPMNLYDFALFMGPVLVALIIRAFSRLKRESCSLPGACTGLAWGALAALLAVLLSGSTLGEVGRIWLFLMPLFAAVPCGGFSRLQGNGFWAVAGGVTAAQVALAFALHQSLALVHP